MKLVQTANVEMIAEFLNRRPDLIPQMMSPCWLQQEAPTSVDDYAQLLLVDAEFRSLQVGHWLGSTNGQVISEAVAQVLPPIYRPEYEFVVNGIVLAANLQAKEGQEKAGKVALGVVVIGLIVGIAATPSRVAA